MKTTKTMTALAISIGMVTSMMPVAANAASVDIEKNTLIENSTITTETTETKEHKVLCEIFMADGNKPEDVLALIGADGTDYILSKDGTMFTCAITEEQAIKAKFCELVKGFQLKISGNNDVPEYTVAYPSYPADNDTELTPSYPAESDKELTSYPAESDKELTPSYPAENDTELTLSYPAESDKELIPSYPAENDTELTPSYPAESDKELIPSYPAENDTELTPSYPAENDTELLIGDINTDGKVDLTDLTELSLAIIGDKTLTESQIKAADIDENGKADLPDLARLRQYLSKVVTSLKNTTDTIIQYDAFSRDYPYYNTISELTNQANQVFSGRITNIYFELLNMKNMKPIKDGDDSQWAMIFTVYEIEVTDVYKGSPTSVKLRIEGGIPSCLEQEQIELLGNDIIPVMKDIPCLTIGENYTFVLFHADESEYSSILNPQQSVYSESSINTHGFSSFDIISYLSK